MVMNEINSFMCAFSYNRKTAFLLYISQK